MRKLSLPDLDLHSKKVLMRVDFNVPLDKNGIITDDTRIRASLPSIEYVLNQGGILILMSHLGRPKDKKENGLTLSSCSKRLSQLLGRPVQMAGNCVGKDVESLVNKLKPGEVILLENLRFHRGEEHPEEYPEFVKLLAQLGDVYIDDAFATAHRKHASTYSVPKLFPEKAAAGFLMEKEIDFLSQLVLNPPKPFCAIIGGAKISTKIGVLKSLLGKVDTLLIGGAMTYTFMKAKGLPIGESLFEPDYVAEAKKIIEASQQPGSAKLFCRSIMSLQIKLKKQGSLALWRTVKEFRLVFKESILVQKQFNTISLSCKKRLRFFGMDQWEFLKLRNFQQVRQRLRKYWLIRMLYPLWGAGTL